MDETLNVNAQVDDAETVDAAEDSQEIESLIDQTSLAAWDVSTPVNCESTFAVKVGAKCSELCSLAGLTITVYDENGTPRGSGQLGSDYFSDSVQLFWVEITLSAPSEPGNYAWEARLAESQTVAERMFVVAAPEAAPEAVPEAEAAVDTLAETVGQVEAESEPSTEAEADEATNSTELAAITEQQQPAEVSELRTVNVIHPAASRLFTFSAVAKPEHVVTIIVVAQDTKEYPGQTRVMLRPYGGYANDEGIIQFEVAPGAYKLFARCDQYEDYNDIIQVESDLQITIELEPSEFEEDYRGNRTRIVKN
jgi:hypothetical protein